MNEFFKNYWKTILYVAAAIIVVFVLFKGISYVYRNTYANEKYQYSSKYFGSQVLDQNVTIVKKYKRNYKEGEIRLTFDKKDLSEEYQFTLGSELTPSNVEVSVIGRLDKGSIKVSLVNGNNKEVFNRVVSGSNIKEVSTSNTFSKNYKLNILTNGAQNGDIVIGFKFN